MAENQYYQNDPRWAETKIGTDPNLTIKMVGCLLTSMTMVMNHFGANETPLTLNQKMVANGGYNGAWIKAFMVPGLFPDLGVKRQRSVECKNKPAPMADIDKGLEGDSLVVVQVDREEDRSFEDEDGHWVVLYQKENNDYLMWDPWKKDGAPDTLVGRYGFGQKPAEDIIQQVIWHGKGDLGKAEDKPAPTATATKPKTQAKPAKSPDNSPMAVKPTVDQLTLRRQPQVNLTNIMKTLSPNDILRVLDVPSEARSKVGRKNQWLRVREPDGSEGYVAAWYVVETAVSPTKPEAAPKKQPASQPAPLNVKISAESVSLRSAPHVADDTLISYLPQGTQLQVIESGAAAAKIGVQDQWLKVQTKDGQKGYVAAWLVAKS